MKCEVCKGPIKPIRIPRFCSHKCKGHELKTSSWLNNQFSWQKATEEERMNHMKEYYMNNVIKQDGCWDWKHGNPRYRYPRMHFSKSIPRIAIHIASWRIHKGEVPDGMWVLHKCDNPRCSNPDHLFIGTSLDNINDMLAKNRNAKGESHGCSKLKNEQVVEIRRLLESGISLNKIAKEFGVSKATILKIKKNKIWILN